jgi:hypothetical protein
MFEDVSLAQWMAFTPHELVQAHLNLEGDMLDSLRKEKQPGVRCPPHPASAPTSPRWGEVNRARCAI